MADRDKTVTELLDEADQFDTEWAPSRRRLVAAVRLLEARCGHLERHVVDLLAARPDQPASQPEAQLDGGVPTPTVEQIMELAEVYRRTGGGSVPLRILATRLAAAASQADNGYEQLRQRNEDLAREVIAAEQQRDEARADAAKAWARVRRDAAELDKRVGEPEACAAAPGTAGAPTVSHKYGPPPTREQGALTVERLRAAVQEPGTAGATATKDLHDWARLEHGVYRIRWKDDDGGTSVAAVGSDASGRRWFAPTNWITVPSFDWSKVHSVRLIEVQHPGEPQVAKTGSPTSTPTGRRLDPTAEERVEVLGDWYANGMLNKVDVAQALTDHAAAAVAADRAAREADACEDCGLSRSIVLCPACVRSRMPPATAKPSTGRRLTEIDRDQLRERLKAVTALVPTGGASAPATHDAECAATPEAGARLTRPWSESEIQVALAAWRKSNGNPETTVEDDIRAALAALPGGAAPVLDDAAVERGRKAMREVWSTEEAHGTETSLDRHARACLSAALGLK